ncbi:MAG TPA: uracil-DNA glycosylase family protein, partial [Pyrinomonadaceae bacterium]
MKDELLELIRDAAEHVSYLRELGVSGVEGSSISSGAQQAPVVTTTLKPKTEAKAPISNPALRRNAQASAKTDSSPALPPERAPRPSLQAGGASTSSEQTEMAKRTTKRTPELEPPPPQDTLFGEITPKDEASLPKSNETLEDIWNDIGECTRCPLAAGRTHIVNSEGNRKARLLFVGEAPGADEDMQARPFVGRAGQLLNKIIEAIGLKREDVMIGNVNRCRPPQNRTPTL